MTLQLDRPLVVLDTETTGVDPEIDRIIQIGIVYLRKAEERLYATDSRIDESYLIDPEEPIPPEATETHGISDALVQGMPPFVQVWPRIWELLDGADICAYNARFDLAMIDAEIRRAGLPPWDRSGVRIIDPLVIFRAQLPHTLEGAMKYYFGAEDEDHPTRQHQPHDAMSDARACHSVLIAQSAGELSIESLAKRSTPPPDDRFCDSGRKFYWRFHRPHHAAGKHKGKPIEYDHGYLEWMVGPRGIPDLPADTRALIEFALAGGVVMNQSSKGIP